MAAIKPIDFRKGHDSLAAMVKNQLRKDPFTGTVFVFRAKRADRLKVLYWDGTGLVPLGDAGAPAGQRMAYKRLEEHTFTWPAFTWPAVTWPAVTWPAVIDGLMMLNHAQFGALFAGLDWRGVRAIDARAPEAVE